MPLRRVTGRVTPPTYGGTMTAHEVFSSLLWIVLLGYIVYLGWFMVTTISGWGAPDDRHGADTAPPPTSEPDADLFDWPPTDAPEFERRQAS